MKNKFKYILAATMLAPFFSCVDFLDTKPLDKMVLEDYWKTRNDVNSTLLACYRALEEDGFMERIILGGELRSDNVIVDNTKLNTATNCVNINDAVIKPTNDLLKWIDFYRVINYCNAVIEFAPGVMQYDPSYSTGFMRSHQAEATAVRALVYFYLVRLYRHVPYVDFPYVEDTQSFIVQPMNGDSLLYRLTEQLEEAEKYALKAWPNSGGSGNIYDDQRGRVTKNMIRALLADIYLWLDEYDKCIAACDRVLPDVLGEYEVINPDSRTGAELRLLSNKRYISNSFENLFFMGNSMESIFELQFNTRGKTNDKVKDLYGTYTSIGKLAAAGNVVAVAEFFEEKDLRKKSSFTTDDLNDGNRKGFFSIFKYVGSFFSENGDYGFPSAETYTPNWIFYRLPDIYLMRAEALVERNGDGDPADALTMVNQTYMRSNPEGTPLLIGDYDNLELMRKLVMIERQREFLFEGKRWFDLLRMARREDKQKGENNHPDMLNLVTRKYEYNGAVVKSKLSNTNALYLPVHWDEAVSNPALKESPLFNGYWWNDIEKK